MVLHNSTSVSWAHLRLQIDLDGSDGLEHEKLRLVFGTEKSQNSDDISEDFLKKICQTGPLPQILQDR